MSSDLLDRTQQILGTAQNAALHLNVLRSELVAREQGSSGGQTENLTTHTQGSDAFYVDPDDLSRLEQDAREYKSYFSQVKFSWMESNIKRRFVQRVLVDNPVAPQLSEVKAADDACVQRKAELKQYKARAEQLQTSIASVAEVLDQELTTSNERTEQVRTLSRSVRGLELDLAVLRNNQPPVDQRMTVAEAEAILAKQTDEMATVNAAVTAARKQIAEKRATLAAAKREADQLEQERLVAERAAVEAERASQSGDATLTHACRHYATIKELLMQLVGVKEVSTLGSPPTEVDIVYAYPAAHLRLRFGPPSAAGQGPLIGAQLVDSTASIGDLLEAHMPSNNTLALVQDVLARLSSSE